MRRKCRKNLAGEKKMSPEIIIERICECAILNLSKLKGEKAGIFFTKAKRDKRRSCIEYWIEYSSHLQTDIMLLLQSSCYLSCAPPSISWRCQLPFAWPMVWMSLLPHQQLRSHHKHENLPFFLLRIWIDRPINTASIDEARHFKCESIDGRTFMVIICLFIWIDVIRSSCQS